MDVAKAADSKPGDNDNASVKSPFEPGSTVRLSGLTEAPQPNGQVAKVIRLAAEKDRYDVQSYASNEEIKSVPAVNLQPLTVIEEVSIWRDLLSGGEVAAADARPALLRLEQLQVTVEILAKTRIGKVVNDFFKRLTDNGEVASLAKQLVTKWKTMFNQSKPKEKQSTVAPSPQKRPRSHESAQASTPTKEKVASSPAKSGASKVRLSTEAASPPQKRPRSVETAQAAAPPPEKDAGPPELGAMDPQIASLLKEKPHIHEFLKKHPSVLQNISADTIAYLTTNLQKAWDTQVLKGEDSTSGSQVTVSNLPVEATEQEVANLFADAGIGLVQVNLPRESRNQTPCGVAWVGVSSPEVAKTAVERLHGGVILQQKVVVEWLEDTHSAAPTPEADVTEPPRLSWKSNHELWREVVFLKDESIEEFKLRMDRGMSDQTPKMPAEGFRAAAGAERAKEAAVVREALSSSGSSACP